MRRLKEFELVYEREHNWIMAIPIVGMVVLLLLARFVKPSVFANLQSIGDALKFLVDAIPFMILPIVALFGLAILLVVRLPKWHLSWLAEDLLYYSKPIRS